ncbi:MAG: hypothetical protein RMK79_12475, partial [Anaerolineae bacterium]|nr:hypothetical protein [Anaerolineae bacterium]
MKIGRWLIGLILCLIFASALPIGAQQNDPLLSIWLPIILKSGDSTPPTPPAPSEWSQHAHDAQHTG